MPDPIYCAFFTAGTRYEAEAARLRKSLDVFALPHDIVAVKDLGDWTKNTKQTAGFICDMLAKYENRPVVYLDADAVVHHIPDLFDLLMPGDCDVAVHYRRGYELLNGTAFFNVGPGARMVAERYREFIQMNAGCTNEQLMLAAAIDDLAETVKIHRLPASYAFIFDIMRDDVGENETIFIEHLQCSRENAGPHSDAWQRRRARLAELERSL